MSPFRTSRAWTAALTGLYVCCASVSAQTFRRGDVNRDTLVTLSDASYLVDAVEGRRTLNCDDAADVNDNGVVDIQDATDLLEFLAMPGAATEPEDPFPMTGTDSTPDGIGCADPSVVAPPGTPNPAYEFDFETVVPPIPDRVDVFLTATTSTSMEAFSLVYKIRTDHQVVSIGFEDTIFPAGLRMAFEASNFFHFRVEPFPPDPDFSLLFVYAVFVEGPNHNRILFPATTGPLNGERLLRIRLNLPPDQPGGQPGGGGAGVQKGPPSCCILELLPPPPMFFAGGLLTEITFNGRRINTTAVECEPCLSDSGVILDFVRGNADCSSDLTPDIIDAMFILNWYTYGIGSPSCDKAMDATGRDGVDLTDGIYLLEHLFLAGPAPPGPYPSCGAETTTTGESCVSTCGCGS